MNKPPIKALRHYIIKRMNLLRSLVWLILILFVGLGATFLVANEMVRANLKPIRPVLVRDTIGVGSHTLTGTIPVSSTCDEVTVKTEQVSSTTYALMFTTWREPHVPLCIEQEVTRQFRTIVFASSLGISFTATLDGEPIPIAVIPDVPLHTASTSVFR